MRLDFIHDEYPIVQAFGDLDLSSAEEFKEKVDAELKKTGSHSFVLNLKNLDFIDSTGLAALLGRHKSVAYGGGRMILSEVPPKVVSMLEMAGLGFIIQSARDNKEALRLLKNIGGRVL